jgi:hypothetical protein
MIWSMLMIEVEISGVWGGLLFPGAERPFFVEGKR